jgi:hypothetical protein
LALPRRGALHDSAALKLGGNPKHRQYQLREVGRGIDNRLGQRPQASPGALHVEGDHQEVSRVAREATAGITTTSAAASLAISFLSWGQSAVAPLIFSREMMADSAALT